jgi:hypothetical protein
VRVISSAIVVVDARRIKTLNLGQLADYIAMTSFAKFSVHKYPHAPTILGLFSGHEGSVPQGMSTWDKVYLKSLYNIHPDHVTQVSEMETRMLDYLSR